MRYLKSMFSSKNRARTISFLMVIVFYAIIQSAIATRSISSLMKGMMVPLCAYVIAALALNLVVGILGDLSLGQAGFMSVGGYFGATVATLALQHVNNELLVLLIAVLAGALIAAVFGVIIGVPILKLQGDYLAIVTLAFGEIVKTIVSNIYLGFDENGLQFAFVNDTTRLSSAGTMIINGPIGLSGNARISTFTIGIVLVLLTLIIIYNLMYSRQGRAVMAVRDNRIAALSVGVDVSKYKLMAFVVSAALAGAAGAFYCMNYSTVSPTKFDFNTSIMILVYVVLGGLGNMNGTIIATAVLLILPEQLREFKDYRMVIYAIILIAMMIITNNQKCRNVLEKIKDGIAKIFRRNKGAADHE